MNSSSSLKATGSKSLRLVALCFVVVFLSHFTTAHLHALPAFPGAEGYGANATGGRGGDVYHVTNLNTSGAGSFADAIATVPSAGRTIVFDVSGHIHVNKTTLSKSKVTIAGQTAPGDGIGFKDGTFIISGDDIVIRHVRFRYGDKAAGGDCIDLSSGTLNAILDQISIEFSTDENISSFSSPPENLTMQWSLNGWGLESHSCGGLWDQNHASCHHSLWAHNHTRNPKARPNGLLEWINNVTFDWDIGFIMGDSNSNASWKANVRGCYFLCPPGNLRSKALEKAGLQSNGQPNFSLYLDNCLHDDDGDGLLNGTNKGYGIASGSYNTAGSPFAGSTVPVTIDAPLLAFKKVLSKAGALRLDVSYAGEVRDEVDAKMISNVLTQTRNHISKESSLGLTNGGFGTLNSAPAPVDTDRDGMPDYWEDAIAAQAGAPQNSTNPAWLSKTVDDHNKVLPSSGGIVTANSFFPANTPAGFTHLEEYLHFLAMPHGTVAKNITGTTTSIQVDLRKFTTGFVKSPSFTVTSATNGTTTQSGTGNYLVTFTPTLNYVGRAKFDFTVTDTDGSAWTQTCALLVSTVALPRDLIWKGAGNAWDNAALNWLRPATGATVAFSSPDRVTFDQSGIAQPSITVNGSQAPGTVEVNAAGNYSFGTAGSISCLGTLTKRGTGALTLANVQAYFGGIALEEGTINVTTGGNLVGGAVSMLDGTTFANLSPNSITIGAPFDVPAGNAATIKTGTRLNLTGAFTGAGTLNYRVETTINRADLSNAGAAFAGNLNFISSGAGGAGVRLFFNGGAFNGFDNAHVDLGNSVSLQPQTNSGGNTLNIGALSGASTAANLSGGTAGAVAYIVGASGADTTFAGSITGNLTFTKTGSGTLTLGGASTYTGATAVNAGGLLIDGALGNTAVTVASGALLGGDGTLGGGVTAGAGSFLSPGTVPFTGATMTVSNGLTLGAATMYCDMSSSPAGANDRISMNGGSITYSGTPYFQFLLLEGVLNAGNYNLVSGATGSVVPGGTPGTFPHNLPTGTRQTFTVKRSSAGANPSLIWLEVLGNPATLTWTGATSANWDTTTASNFTGATPNTFGSNDAVVFDDSSAVTSIALPAPVTPRSTLVNNTTKAFTIAGGINGGSLTKSGANTLTLTGANTFGGGLTLNAGTIVLANDTANNAGLGTGLVTLNAGVISMHDDQTSYNAFTANLVVPAGATARLNADSRVDMYGTLSGAGTLNFFVPYIRTDLYTNWSAFTGIINVLTDASGGHFRMATAYGFPGFPQAVVALTDNVIAYYTGTLAEGAGTTIEIGALSGPALSRLEGGATGGRALTYRIGGRNTDAIFSGTIGEQNTGTATSYVKTGAGIWTLNGSGAWNGSTTVEQGTLKISGVFACAGAANVQTGATLQFAGGSLATDALNIATDAFLTGNGTITGDLNNDGAITCSSGTITVTGNVVNNGTMRFTGGSGIVTTGSANTFVNNGVLDLITGFQSLPVNLENNGIVVDASAVKVDQFAKNGSTFSVSLQSSYVGHNYHLQYRSSLASGSWTTVDTKPGTGAPLATPPVAGALVLTATNATGNQAFYRVLVSP